MNAMLIKYNSRLWFNTFVVHTNMELMDNLYSLIKHEISEWEWNTDRAKLRARTLDIVLETLVGTYYAYLFTHKLIEIFKNTLKRKPPIYEILHGTVSWVFII